MNEIVNRLQENEKLKIIFVSFVTFFLMIVAIMSNSIVSAFTVTDDNGSYNYIYYVKVTSKFSNSEYYDEQVDYFYFNSEVTFKNSKYPSWVSFTTNDNSVIYHNLQYLKNGKVVDSTTNDNSVIYINYGNVSIKALESNSNTFVDGFKKATQGVIVPELKTPPTPTVTGEQVEGIVPAIIKVMKILVPVGLVVLAIFLGIYLVKRLMGLFL